MKSVKSFFRAAKYLGFLFFLFSIFSGCAKYRIEHVDAKKFMKRYYYTERDIRHIDDAFPGPRKKYKVYVYDENGNVYKSNRNLIVDTLLTLKLKKTKAKPLPDSISGKTYNPITKAIHVFLEDSVFVHEGPTELSPSQIEDIALYDSVLLTEEELRGRFFARIFFGIIGSILLIYLVFVLPFQLLGNFFEKEFGCYIATMVYKDGYAPEVVLLRKYRDEELKHRFFGKLFVFYYYKTSPTFVYLTKNIGIVNKAIKWVLDRYVRYLSRKYGYELAL